MVRAKVNRGGQCHVKQRYAMPDRFAHFQIVYIHGMTSHTRVINGLTPRYYNACPGRVNGGYFLPLVL